MQNQGRLPHTQSSLGEALAPKYKRENGPQFLLTSSSVMLITPDHILDPLQPKNPLPPQNTSQGAKGNIQPQLLREHLVY